MKPANFGGFHSKYEPPNHFSKRSILFLISNLKVKTPISTYRTQHISPGPSLHTLASRFSSLRISSAFLSLSAKMLSLISMILTFSIANRLLLKLRFLSGLFHCPAQDRFARCRSGGRRAHAVQFHRSFDNFHKGAMSAISSVTTPASPQYSGSLPVTPFMLNLF